MKKIKREFVKVKKIVVDCEYNPYYEFDCKMCSNPNRILGYDFYIDCDLDIKECIEFIKEKLNQYKQPLMNISVNRKLEEIEEKDLWTKDKIEKCIKKGYK